VFVDDPPAARIINALRDARLISSDRGELRFTHESLFRGWGRLKDQIAEEQRLFEARERLEQYCDTWVQASSSRSSRARLLLDGLLLAEGCELLSKWGASAISDKQPQLPAYITASESRRKSARRVAQAVAWSAALMFAALSVSLYMLWQWTVEALQSAVKARNEAQASYLIDKSSSYFHDGKIALAIENADHAFKLLPSDTTSIAA
jgi:hypothetical protein